MNNHVGGGNSYQGTTTSNKSRNTGGNVPQFKTTAAAVGLSLGSTKGIGKAMLMGSTSTTTNHQGANNNIGNLFFENSNGG
jgi:hypothetical protein